VQFDLEWSSSGPEAGIGAIALTSADGHIEAMAGFWDADGGGEGAPFAMVRAPGADPQWSGTPSANGFSHFSIMRSMGVVTIVSAAVGDAGVLSAELPASIANVAIVTVRRADGPNLWGYGTFSVDGIEVRRGGLHGCEAGSCSAGFHDGGARPGQRGVEVPGM
jgi:hypothetical protein